MKKIKTRQSLSIRSSGSNSNHSNIGHLERVCDTLYPKKPWKLLFLFLLILLLQESCSISGNLFTMVEYELRKEHGLVISGKANFL